MQLYSIQDIHVWLLYKVDDFITSLCIHSRLDLHYFSFISQQGTHINYGHNIH